MVGDKKQDGAASGDDANGGEMSGSQLGVRRAAEMCAVFMIGDGLLGLLQPRRHVALWRTPVTPVDVLVRPFEDRPGLRRGYGLLQIAGGVALASRLKRKDRG